MSSPLRLLVFYGSYRANRSGIRLAHYALNRLAARGHEAELVDAREVGLPMLDRMYKEYPAGEAPPAMEALARKIRAADGFVFVVGEYNWGVQPGLKNLVDHYLEEWHGRPAGLVSYSAGRISGARASFAWHAILPELGMAVVPRTVTVGPMSATLNAEAEPTGESGEALGRSFEKFATDLEWWAEAAKRQREAAVTSPTQEQEAGLTR